MMYGWFILNGIDSIDWDNLTISFYIALWNIGYQKEENVGSPFGIFGSFS